jgi:hypothetical protein
VRAWFNLVLFFATALSLVAQSNSGELRLKISDPAGLAVKARVELSNDAAEFRRFYSADDSGSLTARNLPFGLYRIGIEHESFSTYEEMVEVRSALPIECAVRLGIAGVSTAINVTAEGILVDPHRTSAVNRIDSRAIADRDSAVQGRSLAELVNSQPGWVFEGSAVLHPRGSEYQTQFVVDGVPLTDNRSPSNGPEIEADDVASLTIYTAGIPAEYGRKMGGVVEVDTSQDDRSGPHGKAVVAGGSFGTADACSRVMDGGKTILPLAPTAPSRTGT